MSNNELVSIPVRVQVDKNTAERLKDPQMTPEARALILSQNIRTYKDYQIKNNSQKKVTVRLDDDLYDFVTKQANALANGSRAEYVRALIISDSFSELEMKKYE